MIILSNINQRQGEPLVEKLYQLRLKCNSCDRFSLTPQQEIHFGGRTEASNFCWPSNTTKVERDFWTGG